MTDMLRGLNGHLQRTGQTMDAIVGITNPGKTAADLPPKPTDLCLLTETEFSDFVERLSGITENVGAGPGTYFDTFYDIQDDLGTLVTDMRNLFEEAGVR